MKFGRTPRYHKEKVKFEFDKITVVEQEPRPVDFFEIIITQKIIGEFL